MELQRKNTEDINKEADGESVSTIEEDNNAIKVTSKNEKASLFNQSIEKLNVLFMFSGMKLKKQTKTTFKSMKYRWLYILNSICVLSAVVASIYYIITGILQGKDFIEVTSVAPCLTFSILALLKSFFYLSNEKEVFNLINGIRELEVREHERSQSVEKEKIIREDRNFLNSVINVLYFLNCSMIVVFDMTPLLLIAVKYLKTDKFEMLLPYLDVFSFIPYEFKYWVIAYIHQVWSECVVLLEMGAADYLFFTCCTYIKIQFRLLKHDLEKIISTHPDEALTDTEYKAKFTALINWHQDLIESSFRLETIYSKSNLLNFLSSSLVTCLTGFNVTIVNDIVVEVTFLTFLFMALMQVFFLCFFADMLMTASTEVSEAAYNCRWYSASHVAAKDLHFVLTRAQKPCKLTALGFADVNLNAFMSVLSTSWSYFALLQTVYGNK